MLGGEEQITENPLLARELLPSLLSANLALTSSLPPTSH